MNKISNLGHVDLQPNFATTTMKSKPSVSNSLSSKVNIKAAKPLQAASTIASSIRNDEEVMSPQDIYD